MDSFCVPKTINRHVLHAIAALQGHSSDSMFILVDQIIQQVRFQMRRSRKPINIEYFVKKSLSSLTFLGILVRSGTSEYALHQNLEIDQGVSCIPRKIPTESAAKPVKPKFAAKKPKSMTKKPRVTKTRIVKVKVRDATAKANQDKKLKSLLFMEGHPAFSAFQATLKDLKNARSVKKSRKSVSSMDVELMDEGEDQYSGSVKANCHLLLHNIN